MLWGGEQHVEERAQAKMLGLPILCDSDRGRRSFSLHSARSDRVLACRFALLLFTKKLSSLGANNIEVSRTSFFQHMREISHPTYTRTRTRVCPPAPAVRYNRQSSISYRSGLRSGPPAAQLSNRATSTDLISGSALSSPPPRCARQVQVRSGQVGIRTGVGPALACVVGIDRLAVVDGPEQLLVARLA